MNDVNKCIKIALLSSCDAKDSSWSGTIYHMAQALQRHCGDVSYIGPIDSSKEKLPGKLIHRISQGLVKKNYSYDHCFLVAKKYAKVAAQRLVGQSFDAIVAPAGATVTAFLKIDIPVVLVEDATYGLLHDYYPEFSNLLNRSLYEMNTIENLALKKANILIYSSEWAARSAIEDYGTDPNKVHVAPFGANIEHPPSRELALERKRADRCRLLFVGVDWQRKGGDIAFETLLKLEAMGIAAELIVCGCTPPKEFTHEHMTVLPFLDKNDARQRQELDSLFLHADFLLLPTRAECYGIVFCEANAFGLPVISTNTGGVSRVIHNGKNGVLLPYSARGDTYAETIARLFRDDKRYTELVRASRATIEERLNWDAWGLAVKKILVELPTTNSSEKSFFIPDGAPKRHNALGQISGRVSKERSLSREQ